MYNIEELFGLETKIAKLHLQGPSLIILQYLVELAESRQWGLSVLFVDE